MQVHDQVYQRGIGQQFLEFPENWDQRRETVAWTLRKDAGKALHEIGLLKALGATGRQIRLPFFTEALLLASGGAAAGLAVGELGRSLAAQLYPAIPFQAPWWALVAARRRR